LCFQRRVEADARGAKDHYGESAFVELRNKIGAEPVEDYECEREKRQRSDHYQPANSQGHVKNWRVKRLAKTNDKIVALVNSPPQQERAEHRHKCQRQNE
jgi:hypothetical protein